MNNGVYFLKITRLNIDVEKIERLYLMNSLPVCLIDERRVLYLEFPIKFPGSAYLLKMNILSLVPGNQKTFLIMKDTSHVKIPLQSWEEVVAWLDKTFAK